MEAIVLDSLAFAVRQSPGLYAVLLGSGVSRGAGVPTGWEVMQQLAARVAAQRKEDPGDDPLSWWCRQMGVDPNYSDLLKVLAPTPQARQAILKDFFEPTEDDVDQGRKVPTKAHKEIARLVKGGHIRVILTTNFDRLMENALREEGVEPSILNTPSAIEGALPLAHQQCAVVKLHGDYLDLTMRNTVAELETYPAPYRRLLRRIFDEYGLIVCGWSAEWDIALRKELEKTKQQRFLTYWAQRGEATEAATRLISLRGAQVATIADADSFFEALAGRVEALKEFNLRHPQSTKMAIAELKRYLPEARHRIRLHDQVSKETEAVASQLTIDRFPLSSPNPTPESIIQRLKEYDHLTDTLVALFANGAFFGKPEEDHLWLSSLRRVANAFESRAGMRLEVWGRLQLYPACRLLYGLGISSLAARHYYLAWRSLTSIVVETEKKMPLAFAAHPLYCIRLAPLGITGKLPGSEYVALHLPSEFSELIPARRDFEFLFDNFEYLWSLVLADLNQPGILGQYAIKSMRGLIAWTPQWKEDVSANGSESAFLKSGVFDGSVERYKAAEHATSEAIGKFY